MNLMKKISLLVCFGPSNTLVTATDKQPGKNKIVQNKITIATNKWVIFVQIYYGKVALNKKIQNTVGARVKQV